MTGTTGTTGDGTKVGGMAKRTAPSCSRHDAFGTVEAMTWLLTGGAGYIGAHIVRALQAGANDYILKPFQPAELLARVKRLSRPAA